jgi:hypothetical protein
LEKGSADEVFQLSPPLVSHGVQRVGAWSSGGRGILGRQPDFGHADFSFPPRTFIQKVLGRRHLRFLACAAPESYCCVARREQIVFKSFLIFVLGMALILAGFVTRPSEMSAAAFMTDSLQPVAAGPRTVADTLKDALVKNVDAGKSGVPSGFEFKDRVLWTEVVKDGKTVYTGVLSHWIKHEAPPPLSSEPKDTKLASATK